MQNFRLLLATAFVACCFFIACKNDPKPTGGAVTAENEFNANASTLSGNWINKTFLDRSQSAGSIVRATTNSHQPFMFAFTVLPNFPDSIILFTGDTALVKMAKYKVDTVEILDVLDGKSIFMVYNSDTDKDITVFDGSSGKVKLDKFIKTKGDDKFPSEAFERALNHHLVNADYILQIGKNTQQVLFLADGTVGGLEGYIKFKICVKGDCFKTGPNNDVMMLMKETGEIEYFALSISSDRKQIILSDMKPSEETGEHVWTVDKIRFLLNSTT